MAAVLVVAALWSAPSAAGASVVSPEPEPSPTAAGLLPLPQDSPDPSPTSAPPSPEPEPPRQAAPEPPEDPVARVVRWALALAVVLGVAGGAGLYWTRENA